MADDATDQPAAPKSGERPLASAGAKGSTPVPARGVPAPRPRGGSRTVQELDRIAAAEATRSRQP